MREMIICRRDPPVTVTVVMWEVLVSLQMIIMGQVMACAIVCCLVICRCSFLVNLRSEGQ